METGMETGSEIPRPLIGEPHFEENWTLEEARPVVPLETIEASKHRRLAFRLLGAFAIAVLLGAVAALVSIRLKQSPTIANDQTIAIVDDAPSAKPADSLEPESAEVPELEDSPVADDESSKRVALAQPKSVFRPVKTVHEVKTKSDPEPEPQVDNSTKPEPILVDQWEERRLRRVWKRERREKRSQRNRDLMRIDELFEGRRPH